MSISYHLQGNIIRFFLIPYFCKKVSFHTVPAVLTSGFRVLLRSDSRHFESCFMGDADRVPATHLLQLTGYLGPDQLVKSVLICIKRRFWKKQESLQGPALHP